MGTDKKDYLTAKASIGRLLPIEADLRAMYLFKAAEDVWQELERLGKIVDDYDAKRPG